MEREVKTTINGIVYVEDEKHVMQVIQAGSKESEIIGIPIQAEANLCCVDENDAIRDLGNGNIISFNQKKMEMTKNKRQKEGKLVKEDKKSVKKYIEEHSKEKKEDKEKKQKITKIQEVRENKAQAEKITNMQKDIEKSKNGTTDGR